MKLIVMKKLLPSLALGLLLLTPPLGADVSPLTHAIMQAARELPAGGFVLAELADGKTTYAAAGSGKRSDKKSDKHEPVTFWGLHGVGECGRLRV
ncbi:MAG: hypothetical protein RLZZ129_9 [Verrucomicrobiota bacterium]